MSIELRVIGFVRTDAQELPRHWSVSGVVGTLVIDEEYSEGLRDIEAGQRIVVIFYFHQSPGFSPELLRQTSGQHGRETGVFSICSPVRPNPIGMSVLEVLGTRGASIHVRGLDMLDGTPILDIKPHIESPRGKAVCVEGAGLRILTLAVCAIVVGGSGRRLGSLPTAGRCMCSNPSK